MNRGRLCAVVALLVALSFWFGASEGIGQTPGAGQEAPVLKRLGVINMERAFENSKQKAVLETELESQLRARLSRLEKLETDIKKVQQSMALVESGSTEYLDYQEEVAVKQATLKLYDERFRGELQKRRVQSFDRIYAEIRNVTAQVAEEMSLDVVLQKTLTIDDKMPAWESVIYSRAHFDITEAVLQKLNAK